MDQIVITETIAKRYMPADHVYLSLDLDKTSSRLALRPQYKSSTKKVSLQRNNTLYYKYENISNINKYKNDIKANTFPNYSSVKYIKIISK